MVCLACHPIATSSMPQDFWAFRSQGKWLPFDYYKVVVSLGSYYCKGGSYFEEANLYYSVSSWNSARKVDLLVCRFHHSTELESVCCVLASCACIRKPGRYRAWVVAARTIYCLCYNFTYQSWCSLKASNPKWIRKANCLPRGHTIPLFKKAVFVSSEGVGPVRTTDLNPGVSIQF